MIPYRTPFFLPLLYPSLLWRMPPDEKVVYLTFDDGPVPGPTEFVLEQLSRFAVHATFFCIGDNIRKHPDIFRRILDAGHCVGNHTVNHLNGWKVNTDRYLENVRSFDVISAGAGLAKPVSPFRPPYGCITPRQVRSLANYRIAMWDVLTRDYDSGLSAEACLRGSVTSCREGSIIVFHDSYKARRNMEYALPRMIETLGSKGYVFKTL